MTQESWLIVGIVCCWRWYLSPAWSSHIWRRSGRKKETGERIWNCGTGGKIEEDHRSHTATRMCTHSLPALTRDGTIYYNHVLG